MALISIMRRATAVGALSLTAQLALAGPVIDGKNIPSEFGSAARLATQRFATGFGDHGDPSTHFGSGSELDAMYVRNDGTYLYVGLTGNLENSGNSCMLFIDKNGAAVNDGANPLTTQIFGAPIDGLPRFLAGGPGTGLNQVTFDAAFSPNYCLGWSGGSPVGSQTRTYYLVNWTTFANANGGNPFDHTNTVAGMITTGDPTASGPSGTLGAFLATGSLGILGAADNSNAVGVEGQPCSGDPCLFPLAVNDPLSATTGFEFAIPLSLIGAGAGNTISLFAIVSSPDGYMSNQMLPTDASALGLQNLANPPFDFSTLDGNQYALYTIAASSCPVGGCEGFDLDGNCIVDLVDLATLLANYGRTGADLPGDTNDDGIVDLTDLAALLVAYGRNCN